MVESETNASLSTWSAPECPFAIEYLPKALDDIRLAVMDAFFSLPHGGAEMGGVLFGEWNGERLAITNYQALDCEHAFGPSFTLSQRDEALLADLLAAPNGNGGRPVGWYHSHTRSEIFLSDADCEIHRRFFPEPWQVALVLKPHTFHPTRAGFFFRGADGEIHAETSYNEFVLAPLAGKPGPLSIPDPTPAPEQPAPVIERAQPVRVSEPATPLPRFIDAPQPSSRRGLKIALALLAGFVLGAAAYMTLDLWLPPMLALERRLAAPAAAPAPTLGLTITDSDGQLQIRWNRDSALVQQAVAGVLSINADGHVPEEIQLDRAHLLSGVVSYIRQTERVDVSLAVTQPDGRALREVTMFIGKLPEQKPLEDTATQEQRENLAKQVVKIQSDLDAKIKLDTNLKKSVDQLSKQLLEEQRNHPPGKK